MDRRYEKNKNVERKSRKLGSYKIKKEHIKFIKDTLKNNNDIHIKILYELLKNKFPNLDISRQYIHDLIRDNNITRKRATFEHFPKTYRGEPRDEKAELKAFFKEIKKFNLDDIISIDETSVFTKYSLVVGITNKKCIDYKLYQKGAVNSERFDEFIKEICKNVKNKLIILDNGQIHKKESTRKIIKDSGNFLLYTCPYHPRLNTIEQFFSQMKHYLKLYKSKNFEELKLNLIKSIKNIKKEHKLNK
jgi:transposase